MSIAFGTYVKFMARKSVGVSHAINLPVGDGLYMFIQSIYGLGWCTLGFTMGLPWVFHMKRSIQLVGPEMSFFSEACTLVIRHIAANLGHGLRVFSRGWEACFDGNNNGGSKCMANVGKTW